MTSVITKPEFEEILRTLLTDVHAARRSVAFERLGHTVTVLMQERTAILEETTRMVSLALSPGRAGCECSNVISSLLNARTKLRAQIVPQDNCLAAMKVSDFAMSGTSS